MPVQTENRLEQRLPDYVYRVLEKMFAAYRQVIILQEFSAGLSGSRVFLARPIRADGEPELRCVVKIDYYERIAREWEAYRANISQSVPNAMEIVGEPVHPTDSLWGGLRYPLAGSGTFDVESLGRYFQHASEKQLNNLLQERLFPSLGALWAQRRLQPDLRLQSYYDDLLPYNLVIELAEPPAGVAVRALEPETVSQQVLNAGIYVTLDQFRVVKIFRDTGRLSLDVPIGQSGASRLHVHGIPNTDQYQIDELLPRPLVGRVIETRADHLQAQIKQAMGATWQPGAPVSLADGRTLPDPIAALPGILDMSMDAYVGRLHGDLNLENVLVELQSENAYLIDFARARQDHVLRDLLHLEMAVVTQLLPQALMGRQMPAETIYTLYEQLDCAVRNPGKVAPPIGLEKTFVVLLTIRNMAAFYLGRPGDWREYYYGLILYLIGALKYADLDRHPTAPLPKQVAYLGAAGILHLLQNSPDCEDYMSPPTATASTSPFAPFLRFFDLSDASEHMRSSWRGKAILLLERFNLSPDNWQLVLWLLLAWIAACYLVTPLLRLPKPDNSDRFVASVYYAIAGILIPLAIALITPADYQEKFDLTHWRQKLLLFRLKLTGALAGYNVFAALLVALSVAAFYLTGGSLPLAIWAILILFLPLMFGYIGANRIPADRYVMFDNHLRAHEVDRLFLAVIVFFSSMIAFVYYNLYWLLIERVTGVVTLLVIVSVSIWEQRARNPQRFPPGRTIALLGLVMPLLILLLYLGFTPFFQFEAPIRPADLILVTLYVVAGTSMWLTWWLRHPPPLKLFWLLRWSASIVVLGGLLMWDLWWGFGTFIGLAALWLAVRQRLFPRAVFVHPAPPTLYGATLISLVLALATPLPVAANIAGYAGISALCIWWAYRKKRPATEETG